MDRADGVSGFAIYKCPTCSLVEYVRAEFPGGGENNSNNAEVPADPSVALARWLNSSAGERKGLMKDAISLAAPEVHEQTGNTNRWRVLVIDDDADHVWTLGKILELDGHDVRIAFDEATALATASSFRPELTITGIAMGQMDGYEICRQLRGTSNGSQMVIAALSRFGNEMARLRSRMAGFDIHLVKPIDLDELKIILTDLMLRPQ